MVMARTTHTHTHTYTHTHTHTHVLLRADRRAAGLARDPPGDFRDDGELGVLRGKGAVRGELEMGDPLSHGRGRRDLRGLGR